jgi:hypothetical protein
MGIVICPLGFAEPDTKRPQYSFREVDIYAWIPFGSHLPNHRLSLRKNLKTGKFELYRFYHKTEEEEVIFEGDFETALQVANEEWNKFHSCWAGILREPDEPCQHKPPKIDRYFCPYAKQYK